MRAAALTAALSAGPTAALALDCRFGEGTADGLVLTLGPPDALGRRAAEVDGATIRFREARRRRDDDPTVWRAVPDPPAYVLALDGGDGAGGASLLRYRDGTLVGLDRGACTGDD